MEILPPCVCVCVLCASYFLCFTSNAGGVVEILKCVACKVLWVYMWVWNLKFELDSRLSMQDLAHAPSTHNQHYDYWHLQE